MSELDGHLQRDARQFDEEISKQLRTLQELALELDLADHSDAALRVQEASADMRLGIRRVLWQLSSQADLGALGARLVKASLSELTKAARTERQLKKVLRRQRTKQSVKRRSPPRRSRSATTELSAQMQSLTDTYEIFEKAAEDADTAHLKTMSDLRSIRSSIDRRRRRATRRQIVGVSRAVLKFVTINIALFAVTALIIARATNLLLGSFGLIGFLATGLAAIIVALVVHLIANPFLRRRFDSRLERAVRSLATGWLTLRLRTASQDLLLLRLTVLDPSRCD